MHEKLKKLEIVNKIFLNRNFVNFFNNFKILLKELKEIPYYANYSGTRMLLHDICSSKYFDLIIAAVIGLNVVSMSLEFYMMPPVI